MYEVLLWFTVLSICSLTTVLFLCIRRRIKIKNNPAYVLHSIPTKVNISYDKHIPRHRDQVELKSPQVPLDCDGIQHLEIHQVYNKFSAGPLQPQRINDTVDGITGQYQDEVIASNGTGRFELVHAEVMTQSISENEKYDYVPIQHNPFLLRSKTENDSKSETAKYQNVFVTSQITGSDAISQSKHGTKKVFHSYENLVLQNSKDELNPAGMCNESTSPETQPQNCPQAVILNSDARVSQLLPWVLYQQDINEEQNVIKYFSLV